MAKCKCDFHTWLLTKDKIEIINAMKFDAQKNKKNVIAIKYMMAHLRIISFFLIFRALYSSQAECRRCLTMWPFVRIDYRHSPFQRLTDLLTVPVLQSANMQRPALIEQVITGRRRSRLNIVSSGFRATNDTWTVQSVSFCDVVECIHHKLTF